jgi:hypothetical protein
MAHWQLRQKRHPSTQLGGGGVRYAALELDTGGPTKREGAREARPEGLTRRDNAPEGGQSRRNEGRWSSLLSTNLRRLVDVALKFVGAAERQAAAKLRCLEGHII